MADRHIRVMFVETHEGVTIELSGTAEKEKITFKTSEGKNGELIIRVKAPNDCSEKSEGAKETEPTDKGCCWPGPCQDCGCGNCCNDRE